MEQKKHLSSLSEFLKEHLNFYRVHLLFFTFTPLIFASIFYAANGAHHIPFIDCLFNCVSAMAVCGLAVTNLSSLTGFQQAILFFLMCIGHPVTISFVVVLVRRYYFFRHYEDYITQQAEAKRQKEEALIASGVASGRSMSMWRTLTRRTQADQGSAPSKRKNGTKRRLIGKLQPDMIRRTHDEPKLVNPTGEWVNAVNTKPPVDDPLSAIDESPPMANTSHFPAVTFSTPVVPRPGRLRRMSDPGVTPPSSLRNISVPMKRSETITAGAQTREDKPLQRIEPLPEKKSKKQDIPMSKTQTIEFSIDASRPGRSFHTGGGRVRSSSVAADGSRSGHSMGARVPSLIGRGSSMNGRVSSLTQPQGLPPPSARHSGFGGFPMPHEVLNRLMIRFFPNARQRIHRTLTMPRTTTMVSERVPPNETTRTYAPYFSFSTLVGRNSFFHLLSEKHQDEIGGVEYRALNTLLWIIPLYHVGLQLLVFTVVAPYMHIPKWADNFVPPQLIRPLNVSWFSIFQVVSAYTNTGMSLVDQSFLPFQTAYPMIIFCGLLILAGNTAFPVFLRFTIWALSKAIPKGSRTYETLRFLLDHPRRCYIYLFPAQQTWFLLSVVLFLTCIDWFCFMVLDIGNPAIENMSLGLRFIDGLFQSLAVRAAGFGIVPLASLSPAVMVTYVIMMYISVYPIAMSVRSTNVYEEQSLGIYHDADPNDVDLHASGHSDRITVWSRYLAVHIRKQLAFDMWWLGVALWLVCIIERSKILDDNLKWFNIFSIVFELVSGYGTVGLSLGIPTENYSFSGSFSTLSKLVVCIVILRGRHRGLPVAIDRAVLLPKQLHDRDNVTEVAASTRADDPSLFRARTYSVGRMSPIGEVITARNSLQDSASDDTARKRHSSGTPEDMV